MKILGVCVAIVVFLLVAIATIRGPLKAHYEAEASSGAYVYWRFILASIRIVALMLFGCGVVILAFYLRNNPIATSICLAVGVIVLAGMIAFYRFNRSGVSSAISGVMFLWAVLTAMLIGVFLYSMKYGAGMAVVAAIAAVILCLFGMSNLGYPTEKTTAAQQQAQQFTPAQELAWIRQVDDASERCAADYLYGYKPQVGLKACWQWLASMDDNEYEPSAIREEFRPFLVGTEFGKLLCLRNIDNVRRALQAKSDDDRWQIRKEAAVFYVSCLDEKSCVKFGQTLQGLGSLPKIGEFYNLVRTGSLR